jgi:hypothetical protein
MLIYGLESLPLRQFRTEVRTPPAADFAPEAAAGVRSRSQKRWRETRQLDGLAAVRPACVQAVMAQLAFRRLQAWWPSLGALRSLMFSALHPTLAVKPPSGPDWVHEMKHDGDRLMGCRSYFSSNSTNSMSVVPVFFTALVCPASCQMKSPSYGAMPRSADPGTISASKPPWT